MKQIKSIFKNHPTAKEVHVTSDKTIFFEKHHAVSHSNGLEDDRVKTITREEADAIPDDESEKTEASMEAVEKEVADKLQPEKEAEEKQVAEKEATDKATSEAEVSDKTSKEKKK
jgi:hypothetical protein